MQEFLVESYEAVSQIERDLVALEEDPENLEILKNVFRLFHSIKGTCGFVNLAKLETIAHKAESLLDKLRSGTFKLNRGITNTLLAVLDATREILSTIEKTGDEGDNDYADLTGKLSVLLESGELPHNTANENKHTEEAIAATDGLAGNSTTEVAKATDSTIRVHVAVLDYLMNLAGELVLARNQVLECTERFDDPDFIAASQRLGLVTTELQVGVMKARMLPIATIWNNFSRVVRDVSLFCGKKVRLETQGKDTEVDRTLIEAMRDPLTHVVRNSIDHGIERPEVRAIAGKPEEGCITLNAFHEGGLVNIEIRDDGAGIDVNKVKQKAIALGLLNADAATRMTDREAIALILTPGFSTAEKTTNLSGRGVGMDVVRTNIEKIGGTVDIVSVSGQGTSVKIKVPLTLAIIPALIITSRGERFALPQINLRELVRLEGETATSGIEQAPGGAVYRLRGKLLPILYLNDELKLSPEEAKPKSTTDSQRSPPAFREDVTNIVVLSADERTFGLVVDEINDTQEIVVKPLGKQLTNLDCYTGATIMGDGAVALILDAAGLARRAHVSSRTDGTTFVAEAPSAAVETTTTESMVLFHVENAGYMAVPATQVSRLEEIDRSKIEHVGDHDVVQYRGEIMQLISVTPTASGRSLGVYDSTVRARDPTPRPHEVCRDNSDSVHVLVFSHGRKKVGLVVDRILDIVDEDITLERPGSHECVRGIGVLAGRVTEFLDVEAVIQRADPTFFTREEEAVAQPA